MLGPVGNLQKWREWTVTAVIVFCQSRLCNIYCLFLNHSHPIVFCYFITSISFIIFKRKQYRYSIAIWIQNFWIGNYFNDTGNLLGIRLQYQNIFIQGKLMLNIGENNSNYICLFLIAGRWKFQFKRNSGEHITSQAGRCKSFSWDAGTD